MNRLCKELSKDKPKNNKLIRYWKNKTGYKSVRKTVIYRQILKECGNEFQEPIYNYIKKHQGENIDMIDICIYFKLSADIIGKDLDILEQQKRIKRENYFGCNYRYVTI